MSEEIKITEGLIREEAPERPGSGHKNDFGHLLLCAGSKYMTGALVLSASSALRSGAGLVTAFSADDALLPVKIKCPCAITSAWEDDVSSCLRKAAALLKKTTAVAIGPGLDEQDPRSRALVEFFLNEARVLLLDAGALNIVSHYSEELMPVLASRKERGLLPAVLTPHVGEMRRLVKGDVTHEVCTNFAAGNTCLLVLKNNKTLIYTPHNTWYSIQGDNSGLAKGGSGDVLTGLAGGFLAQGIKPCSAAAAAVYFHSKAGKLAASAKGERGMTPEDVIDKLPDAFRETGW